ncbi:alpha-amylase family protein [Cellulomonas sp. JH27-2]|uniref:alpha-amylase family protein n=1 Tax=Cellulomonas sp. JH27-2 TaxID=2774139 RepID=UPI0017843237|nr:alpha-amylase family protein [Cellulomonas sp. JH27-2]MBD8059343.1 alpha-amylase family protein [Cellulomonas sp. JH27-2]
MGWVEHAVWWQVYPLGFVGAADEAPEGSDPRDAHRLRRLIDWLDYARDLGVNGLALGPVFASSTHGYDTTDHLRIDPRLGDRSDFDALVTAAHERGLRVLLDGVFNHVGRAHPMFTAALAGGPEGALFRIDRSGDEPTWDCFEGHRDLVTLNHSSPAVADLVADVMIHWLDAGADGWRLDAAYAVPPAFWVPVLERVRAAHPDVYVVGEVIHGDYSAIVAESGFDSVTQYELWKAIWSALSSANFWELAWSLDRHSAFVEQFAPWTFVGNHDVTRIATQVDDDGLLALALVVLFTVGGTPAVYYGDEQAFRGLKEERFGGDDAIRPAFPASPDDLAPDGAWAYRLHQELIGLRRRHPWLHRATTRTVELSNEHLLYEASAGGDALLVALNLDPDEPWDAPATGELLAGPSTVTATTTTVPARGWAVLAP